MNSYLKDKSVEKKSDLLSGQEIAVAICGGIGAVEIVKIIRELRRHGANVTPFMSKGAERFITPLSVGWAADRPAVVELTAEVEYLKPFQVVLVAPATLNTLNKSAQGVADTVVTLLIATQISKRGSVLFVPAMNAEMASHPLYQSNLEKLSSWGCRFYEGKETEWRYKMPEPEKLVEWVCSLSK